MMGYMRVNGAPQISLLGSGHLCHGLVGPALVGLRFSSPGVSFPSTPTYKPKRRNPLHRYAVAPLLWNSVCRAKPSTSALQRNRTLAALGPYNGVPTSRSTPIFAEWIPPRRDTGTTANGTSSDRTASAKA